MQEQTIKKEYIEFEFKVLKTEVKCEPVDDGAIDTLEELVAPVKTEPAENESTVVLEQEAVVKQEPVDNEMAKFLECQDVQVDNMLECVITESREDPASGNSSSQDSLVFLFLLECGALAIFK